MPDFHVNTSVKSVLPAPAQRRWDLPREHRPAVSPVSSPAQVVGIRAPSSVQIFESSSCFVLGGLPEGGQSNLSYLSMPPVRWHSSAPWGDWMKSYRNWGWWLERHLEELAGGLAGVSRLDRDCNTITWKSAFDARHHWWSEDRSDVATLPMVGYVASLSRRQMGLSPGLTVWDAVVTSAWGTVLYSVSVRGGPRVDGSGMVMDLLAVMVAWAVQDCSWPRQTVGPYHGHVLMTHMFSSATTICLHNLYGPCLRCQSVLFQVTDPNSYSQWVPASDQ